MRCSLAPASAQRRSARREEGQRYVEQAAALTEEPVARAELIDRAGQLAWQARKPAEARALLESARADYEKHGEAAACRQSRRACWPTSTSTRGTRRRPSPGSTPALAALESAGSDSDVAALAAQLGRFLVFVGDLDAAAPQIERALTVSEALDLPETLAQALNTKSVLMMRRHRPREALILVRGALAIAVEHDLHAAALRAYNNLAATLLERISGTRGSRP